MHLFLLLQLIPVLDPCKHCSTQLLRESSAGQHPKQPTPAEGVHLVHREFHLPPRDRKTEMKERRGRAMSRKGTSEEITCQRCNQCRASESHHCLSFERTSRSQVSSVSLRSQGSCRLQWSQTGVSLHSHRLPWLPS